MRGRPRNGRHIGRVVGGGIGGAGRWLLGTLGFDKNGDSTQQFVTFHRVDRSADGGAGDWATLKQEDFGPAP